MRRLTEAQKAILSALDHEPGDGWLTANNIAEMCGHFYNTPWASSKLPGLVRRGLIEKDGSGYYSRITSAGRAALQQEKETGR